ncbi:MAG: N-acetyl-alpha-D-glucosaminyl L-malate synthase [Elusimicrobia bacterium]|nr:N-acetyl-alpha-D-glucosaminyl L-malate synthase [Elusimicrobiota bacterium]
MIIQNFYPSIGGAEQQALEVASGLVAQGFYIVVLTRSQRILMSRERVRGVYVRRLFSPGWGGLRNISFAISSGVYLLWRWWECDVIHIHLASSHSLFPALLGRLFHKRVIIKLSGGIDIGELALSRKNIFGRIKLWLLHWARPAFIIVNEGQRQELINSGLADCPVQFIPNGLRLDWFLPLGVKERFAVRQKLDWTGLVFLFVGRFAQDKLRPDIFRNLMEAWKRFSNETKEVSFYLVGEGPLRSTFQALIEELGVAQTVKILNPQADVRGFYQAADVFVLPSITEGLSNAMLEAMACGLPLLGSRVSGIVDVVSDEKEGVLFDPLNTNDIYSSLTKISQNKTYREDMGKKARERASNFSLEKTIQKTIQLYENGIL